MIYFRNFKSQKVSAALGIISKFNIKFFITLICLTFIGFSIYANFESLVDYQIGQKEIFWLSGSIIFNSLSIFINAFA